MKLLLPLYKGGLLAGLYVAAGIFWAWVGSVAVYGTTRKMFDPSYGEPPWR